MIRDRKTLKEYISADKSRYIVRYPAFLGRILNDESYFILQYLKCLRHIRILQEYPSKKYFLFVLRIEVSIPFKEVWHFNYS